MGLRNSLYELLPLSDAFGLSGGPTKGGLISYRAAEREECDVRATSATQWFAKTGELWGFDGEVVYTEEQNRSTLATTYVVQCWARFLRCAFEFYTNYNINGPFKVQVGLTQLEGLWWPQRGMRPHVTLGLEESALTKMILPDLTESSRMQVLSAAHSAMRAAFGMNPDENELRTMLENSQRT
jgi:hypothetical protein